MLHVRDLFAALHDRGIDRVDVRALLRPAIIVPETKPLDELLAEFRSTSNHMAIVVDEYGSVAGLVTLEDLLEEIVGEIGDEFDRPETGILRIGKGRVRIGGSFPIDEFNERFGTDLSGDDYHSVGGFVFGELGRAPQVGDSVAAHGARFEVSAVDGPRIIEVDVTLLPAEQPAQQPRLTSSRAASSSLRRAIADVASVIPPALWLTQASSPGPSETKMSGMVVGRPRPASAIRFGERHRPREVGERVATCERAVAHLPAVELETAACQLVGRESALMAGDYSRAGVHTLDSAPSPRLASALDTVGGPACRRS